MEVFLRDKFVLQDRIPKKRGHLDLQILPTNLRQSRPFFGKARRERKFS